MIREDSALIAAIDAGKRNALEGKIVTFGITPNYPATGYGYIKISKKVNEHQGFEVLQFVEKPPLDKAKAFFASQEYYWNSGMFLFEPSHLLTEMQAHAPEIVSSCQKSFQNMREDLDFLRLDQEEFTACPNQSIDYAIMEKTKRGVLIPLSVEWSDVGSWISLDEIQPKDENNNILQGDVSQQNVENTYIRADHRLVVAIGIKNQIIVETKDVILIADKSQIDILKERMEHLKNEDRHEVEPNTL